MRMEETAAANEAPRHDGSETRRSASAGSFKSFVARRVLPRLPNAIARRIRRAYYLRLVRTSQPDQLPCRPVVEALVQTGDGVVDIGANIGVFTRYLADRVGPKGRVWAIEPVPETFDALAFNVRRLKLRNVEPIHCAVSDREGFVTMSIPRFHDGAENYYRAKIGETDRADAVRNVRVPVRSLDSILAGVEEHVTFIKCDVEGHELHVLRGAARVLDRARAAWLIEVWGDPAGTDTDARRLRERMREKGYGMHLCEGRRLIPWTPGLTANDYLFLRPEHVERIRHRGIVVE